jgi:hypothetical protein
LRGFHAFDDLYEALAQPDGDHALLLSRLAALDAPGSPVVDLSLLRIALGDHEHRVSIYLTWLPAFAAYRKSPAFKATVIDGGLLAYWRAEGFPLMCGHGALRISNATERRERRRVRHVLVSTTRPRLSGVPAVRG